MKTFFELYNFLNINETHKLTTQQDLVASGILDQPNLPGEIISETEFVKNIYRTITSGYLNLNKSYPELGTLIASNYVYSAHVSDWYNKQNNKNNNFRFIQCYLYDPQLSKSRGMALPSRLQIRIFYDPQAKVGIKDDKKYDDRTLLSIIYHEMIHMSDPGMNRESDKFLSNNKDWFLNNYKHYTSDSHVEKDTNHQDDQMPMDQKLKRFKKYLNTDAEKKAWAGGMGYEVADRIAGQGNVDRKKAQDELRKLPFTDYSGIRKPNGEISTIYTDDREKVNRTKRAAWDHLNSMVPESPSQDTLGRGADYYKNLKQTNPEEYEKIRQNIMLKKQQPQKKSGLWSKFSRLLGR